MATGSGRYLDFGGLFNIWQKLRTTFTAEGGFAIGTRADGYLDPSLHPPLGILGGRFQPAPHFLNPPNNNFEDGLTGWTATKTGTGTSTRIDATAANKLTGLNSAKMITAAAADTSVLTGPMFPAGAGIPLSLFARAKSAGSAGRVTVSVAWFTNASTANGTATLAQVTGLPTTYAEYGAVVVPPAGTSYAQVIVKLDTAADTVWVDEVLQVGETAFDFDLRRFGVYGDGATDDTPALQRALAFLSRAGGVTLCVRANHYLNPAAATTITIPANVEFKPSPLGRFKLGSKMTLSVLGRVNAGVWQVFDTTTVSGGVVTSTGTGLTSLILPEWWGAVADDSTDCTAAFKAAVSFASARGGGKVFVRASAVGFAFAGPLYVPTGVYIVGESTTGSQLINTAAMNHGIILGNDGASYSGGAFRNNGVTDLSLYSAGGSKSNGAGIIIANSYTAEIVRFIVDSQYIGIQLYQTSSCKIADNYSTGSTYCHIYMSNGCVNDLVDNNNCDGATRPRFGMYVGSGCNGQPIRSNNVADCLNGLAIQDATQVIGQIFFIDNYWDSCSNVGVRIYAANGQNILGLHFLGEWSATHGQQGFLIATEAYNKGLISGVEMTSPKILNNGNNGLYTFGNVQNVNISNPQVSGNSQTSSGTNHGLDFGVGCSRISVTGGIVGPQAQFTGSTQGCGILFQEASGGAQSDYLLVQGVMTTGNASGGILNNSGATHTAIANNL